MTTQQQQTPNVSPIILQLLGKWREGEITFEVPQRLDLYKRRTDAFVPTVMLNQFSICTEAEHVNHVLTANSAVFPGAENQLLPLEGPPEPENLNWQPYLREDHILNWNLEEEELAPLVEEEEEEQQFRHRRQVKTKWETQRIEELERIASKLGPDQYYISCYM